MSSGTDHSRGFVADHYYQLGLLVPYPKVEKIFAAICSLPSTVSPLRCVVMIFSMSLPNLLKIDSVGLGTTEDAQRTTEKVGRRPMLETLYT